MIIEKTVVDNNRWDICKEDYVAEGEITVTITLGEYRDLVVNKIRSEMYKEHENWLKEYNRANDAESRVKALEEELQNLYKRININESTDESEDE